MANIPPSNDSPPVPCPDLDGPILLYSKEGPYVDPIASIGTKASGPAGKDLPHQASWPAYVTMAGTQQFCAYPVTILREKSLNQGPSFFGKLADLHSNNTTGLPIGSLVTKDGTSFAPSPLDTSAWYYVGSQNNLASFFHIVASIAEQLEWRRLEDPERFLVSPEPKQPFDPSTPLYPPEEAWSEMAPFFDWMQSTLPSLWDQVNGMMIYVPTLGFAEADYDPMIDRIHFGPAFIEMLKADQYAVAAASLIHELTHQESYDRGIIYPLYAMTCSAISLWLYNGNQVSELAMQDPLISSTAQAITTPPGGFPEEEGIAYAAMCGKTSMFSELEKSSICQGAAINNEQILSLIENSSYPKEAFPLTRGYLEDGLRRALPETDERIWGKIFLNAFDRHVACSQGEIQQCPDWPLASLWDSNYLFAP